MQRILKVAILSPLRQHFDYLAPPTWQGLTPGVRLLVPFRNKKKLGILLAIENHSDISLAKLKAPEAILDESPLLPDKLFKLLNWASSYYHHPIGEVLASALPRNMQKGKEIATIIAPPLINNSKEEKIPSLNQAQQQAIDTILTSSGFNTFLLDGVTGSGKTEVYLRIIANVIACGKQALILVPEIGLTPQMVERLRRRFTQPIAVLHSALKESERLHAFQAARQGLVDIVIGTRSALFSPLANLGVIILDEEHDTSFKQQSGFRYSAKDLAIMRARLENIPIILGSATPALESLYKAKIKNFSHLTLPERAGTALHPSFKLLDIKNNRLEEGLSPLLLTKIKQHLASDNQVLLFLNRRGYAPTLLCHSCSWIAHCKRCDSHLTMHQLPQQLCCHHCQAIHPIPNFCPQCKSRQLINLGLGTERLEEALKKNFPQAPCIRLDSDSTRRKGSLEKLLQRVANGKGQILIGTQMLAKGHHFPNVTMVGIIDADAGLFSADFRATERTAQTIIQVAGRAGRANKPGEVFIQTHNPDHGLLQQLIQNGYHAFADTLLQERRQAKLPPFSYLVLWRANATCHTKPLEFLNAIADIAKQLSATMITARDELEILGPIPAVMERKAGRYHAQLLLQSSKRQLLQSLLRQCITQLQQRNLARQVRWSLDVDPVETF